MRNPLKILNHLRRTLAVSIVGLALSVTGAVASDRAVLGEPTSVAQAALSSPALRTALQKLASSAEKNGSVRVIVGVRAAFAPEGKLSAVSAIQQRSEIASAQSAVLSRLPQATQKSSTVTVRRFAGIPYLAMSVTAQQLKALEQMPEVTSIKKDRLVRPTLFSSVPFIGGTTAVNSGYSGAGQTVAVLDTGVDKTHPFLAGKVVAEACYSTIDASDSATSICPDGVSVSTAVGSGAACVLDGCAHGTHVAGIVAGAKGSDSAPAGVAKDANLIAMQVFSKISSEEVCGADRAPCVSGYDSDLLMALERVYALRNTYSIAAVNMSLGGESYSSQSLCDDEYADYKAVIDSLRSVNIATIISSGNDGYADAVSTPGCVSSAVSVGATWVQAGFDNSCRDHALGDSTVDAVTCFSNSASFLSLLAPGAEISSSIAGGGYKSYSGTSMAAPHVAGAWAVLKQKNPSATVSEVLNAFITKGKPVTDPRNGITTPRIQVAQALGVISANASDYALSLSIAGSGSVTSSPAGIDCGSVCSSTFRANSHVTLTAKASSGHSFAGWSGACTGTSNTCAVTMSAARNVVASFVATGNTRLIALSKSGQGTVVSNPKGIYCDVSCGSASSPFGSTSSIVLTAIAAPDSTFAGWSGACSGTEQCKIAAGTSTVNVTALFNSNSGSGSGPVTLLNQSNLAGATDSNTNFVVQVPMGATNLAVSTSGGSGDVDMYVRFGAAPTLTSHDCVSAYEGNDEICGFTSPQAGKHHILLKGAYSGVTLRVTYRLPSVQAALNVTKTGTGDGSVQSISSMAAQMQSLAKLVNPSIVGGTPAQSGAWPWQVRLSVTTQQGTFLCGGSLISDQWVLTAAHCVEDGDGSTLSPASFKVRAGSLQIDSGGVVTSVSRVVKHPAYESATMDNDIALLRLSSPLTQSKTIRPIAPLSASQEQQLAATNTLATVTGWGTTSSGGDVSAVLMQAQVPLISSSDCAAQSAYSGSQLSSNMICAGYPQGGKDSCQGDSGGPLVVPNGQGSHVLAGIVSWGESCAAPDYPGVYTRVANYQPWLQSQTQIPLGAPLIDCGTACSATVDIGTTITLRAQANKDSEFVGWGGACSGTADTCSVVVDVARSVTANFSAHGVVPLSDPTDFVTQQYQDFLGSVPEKAGLDHWVGQLNSGAATRAQVAEEFMHSDAFQGRLGPIVRLYTAYFKRLPDYEGLMYWYDRMHPSSGAGLNLVQVSEGFAQSIEFANTYGNLDNAGFVTRVYQNVLGRDPEAEGYAYWMGRLNSGMSRGEVMVGFSESIENQQASANSQLVTLAYTGLLRRVPQSAEHARWLADIQSGRATVLNLIDNLLKSSEYAARF